MIADSCAPTEGITEEQGEKAKWATMLLAFSMFSTGACGLVSEYILATVSTYILGNSIEQFSITIGLMMFMMGVAAWAQKFTNDELLVEKFIFVEVLLAILCSTAPIIIYAAYGFMENHFPLVQYFFVMSIGFLIGFEIPVVLRINEKYSNQLKANLGNVLSFDYFGSLAGAVVWYWVLLKYFPLTEISIIVAAFNFVIASIAFIYFYKKGLVKYGWAPFTALAFTAVLLVGLFMNNRGLTSLLEQKIYEDPIVFSKTTKYQHLVITHDRGINDYRLYINGNTQFSSIDEAIYHEQLIHPVMSLAPSRKNVLILGGGDGLALREVLKYRDVESVTLVDLDPEMTRIASTDPVLSKLNNNAFKDARVHVGAPAGIEDVGVKGVFSGTGEGAKGREQRQRIATVEVYNIDADRFVEFPGRKYNVVVIDFPDPNAVELTKLYSREFYLKLRRSLAEDSKIVVQATSPFHAKEAYLTIGRTMVAAGYTVLPYHDNVPSFGDWGWFIAWVGGESAEDLKARAISLDSVTVPTRYWTPELFIAACVFGKGGLIPQTKNAQLVNTLMHPVLLQLYNDEGWKIE